MKLNICIEGTPEEVNKVIGSWKASEFIENVNELMSLKNRIGSLELCQKFTDATLHKLTTGELKVVGITAK